MQSGFFVTQGEPLKHEKSKNIDESPRGLSTFHIPEYMIMSRPCRARGAGSS